ncbi:MAG: phage head closure protein, partial [Oscillospiraceae bacterium]|nr:phage head closure protein [Oscillospiraceae bacterium]
MDISLLNVRITLQKATASIDDIGNHLHVWVDYYDCFATVSGEGGRENIYAGNMQDNAEIAFTVRYC